MTKRILPADVYDYLELMAEAYGGVGAGEDFEWSGAIENLNRPCCAWGLAFAGLTPSVRDLRRGACITSPEFNTVITALNDSRIRRSDNDDAVDTINRRLHRADRTRVPFDLWCEELNVVRGA